MNIYPYNFRIECTHSGYYQIYPQEMLLCLKKTQNDRISFFKQNNLSLNFYIPGITIAAVHIFLSHYYEKELYGYEISLQIPCCPEDLGLFQAIIEYIETKCREAGRHRQMSFDRCSNYPGKHALSAANIAATWQHLMDPFFNSLIKDEAFYFRADNGKLMFLLMGKDYKSGSNLIQLINKFLPLVRDHIWQQLYTSVITEHYYIVPIRQNGLKCKGWIKELVLWDNSAPVRIGDEAYVTIKADEEWKAIRPQKWKKILSPYFHQYDAIHNNLLPVIPQHIFEELKARLLQFASSLLLTCTEKDGELSFAATV